MKGFALSGCRDARSNEDQNTRTDGRTDGPEVPRAACNVTLKRAGRRNEVFFIGGRSEAPDTRTCLCALGQRKQDVGGKNTEREIETVLSDFHFTNYLLCLCAPGVTWTKSFQMTQIRPLAFYRLQTCVTTSSSKSVEFIVQPDQRTCVFRRWFPSGVISA